MSDIPNTPQPDDDFDKDITGNLGDLDNGVTRLQMGFAEIHEAYHAMRSVGFTETEALKYLAFCSIYDGDF